MDEKAKLETFIQKNLARASTTKMAQSRRKVLEKTNWMDSPDGDEKVLALASRSIAKAEMTCYQLMI